jgi:hypothetical protein
VTSLWIDMYLVDITQIASMYSTKATERMYLRGFTPKIAIHCRVRRGGEETFEYYPSRHETNTRKPAKTIPRHKECTVERGGRLRIDTSSVKKVE